MTKTLDENDRLRAGTLPEDPEADTEVMLDPKLSTDIAKIASFKWIKPTSAWLDAKPHNRPYLLHAADGFMLQRGPGMLPRSKVCILAAAGGAGKTFALCGLALSVVTRRPWLGSFPVGEGVKGNAVLILGEEDESELRRRLYSQAQAMGLTGLEHGEAVGRILALPGAGLDTLALTQSEEHGVPARTLFAGALYAFLESKGMEVGGWDVVILDPLSRFAGPDVEIDNAAATRLIQVLERFTQLPGAPTVLVAHHTNKTSRDKDTERSAAAVRGSSALVDGARWVGDLDPVIADYACFRVVKSNYGRIPPEPTWLKRVDDGGLRMATQSEIENAKKSASKPTTTTKIRTGDA